MRSFRRAALSCVVLSVLILSALCYGQQDRIIGPINTTKTVKLSGGVPAKAKRKYDQGPVDPSLKLSYMTLLTAPSAAQQRDLNLLLAEQQNSRSPLFHQWLTPEQYADRFGLSTNDIQKLTTWLESEGFSVINVARGRNFIVFSGTAAQAESVFQTQIHTFDVRGEKSFSNTAPPSIPAALVGIVTGFRGLSNFRLKPSIKQRNPQYTYSGSGGAERFIAPGDIATIYDTTKLASAGVTGTGQTIAVIGQTNVYLADLVDFRSTSSPVGFSLPAITGCSKNSSGILTSCAAGSGNLLQYIQVNGNSGGAPSLGDLPEADLDLEWSGATAPNAQIIFVNASDPNGGGVWDSWYYAVDNKVSPVITMSYGTCEYNEAQNNGLTGEFTFVSDEAELQKANSEGITFMNSAGDAGAAACDPDSNLSEEGLAVNYPASSPEVTGVGGTMIPYDIAGSGAYYGGTYWSSTNGSTGGSLLCPSGEGNGPCIPENSWDDSAEFGAYCAAGLGVQFCTAYGITDQESAQLAIGIGSGGGGYSSCTTVDENDDCSGGFAQPSWQAVTVPGQVAARLVPDVSLLASPNWPGYIWCTPIEELSNTPPYDTETTSSCANGVAASVAGVVSGGQYVVDPSIIGGTSASSPVFAGIVALLNEYLVKNGAITKPGLGNINPILYLMGVTAPSAFHQGTGGTDAPGSNTVYCDPGSPGVPPADLECPAAIPPAMYGLFGYYAATDYAANGYNSATGLGSVDAFNLASNWAAAMEYGTTTTTLASSLNPANQGQSVTFTATVATTGANPPTGTVSFNNQGTTVGTGTLSKVSGAQVATFVTSALPAGTDTITALYEGDTANAGSISTILNQVVNEGASFTLTANPTTVSIAPGGAAGTSTITVVPSGGFTGSVSLAATGQPTGVTAGFVPNPTTNTSTLSLTASGSVAAGTYPITITGTSGSLTATTTVTLTVTAAPTFTVSANPNTLTIVQGTNGTSTITVTSLNGFNSSTTLSASGLPSGVTAGFVPSSVTPPANGTATSTLTLTASGTAATGTATVTITGTSGSTTASTTISLTITPAPSFTLSDSPTSVTIAQGGTGGTSTITITAHNGFSGNVTLGAAPLPTGVTAVFSPNPATSTSTLTLTASGSATLGTTTVTITGTSGSLSATTTLSLTVNPPPLTLSCSSGTGTVGTAYSSSLSSTGGVPPDTFSISNGSLPPGLNLTGSSGLISGNPTTAGNFNFTAKVVDSASNSTTSSCSIVIAAGPSFTLAASPASVTITPGLAGATSTITVTDLGGFTGSVSLAASGQPSGVTAVFNPSSTTTTSVLTLTAAAGTTPGNYTVTVTGTSGSLSATTTVSLTVTQPPSFTVSAAPNSVTINQGSNGTSTITVTSTNGFNSAVALSASGLPAGVTAGFVPTSVTPPANGSGTSTLTLTVGPTVAANTYTVTITGTSGSTTALTTVTLTVAQPFTLAASAINPATGIVPGSTGTSTVTIADHNGFAGNVSLTASNLPSGVTAAFNPNPATSTSTLTLTASPTAAPTTTTVTISGVSSGVTATATVSVTVVQNFTLPVSVTAPPSANPGQTTSTTMSVSSADGGPFTTNVTFTCPTGLPTGATCSATSITAGASSPQTVTITVNTAGPFTGAAGGIIRGFERKLTRHNQRLWLPLSAPLAGMLFVGLIGKRVSRNCKILGLCLTLGLAGFLVACGSGSGSTPTTVTPSSASVQLGGTQQFTANATGVTWSLSGAGAVGSINTSSGLYTAPTTGTTPASFTVVATPTTGTAGSASVTIPAVGVSVTPPTVNTLWPTLGLAGEAPQTQQFSSTVTNDSNNTNVTWSVVGGSANGTIDANGLYTAPAAVPAGPVTVTATSAADTSKSGNATVTIQTPTPAGSSSVTVNAIEGSVTHSTTFTLTVN
jgi:hypothetical protein